MSDGPYAKAQRVSPKSSFSALPNANKPLPAIVQSPSGNFLGATEFISRSDRPLAIRERQESIRWALQQAQKEIDTCEVQSRKPSWASSYRKWSKDRQASESSGNESFGSSLGKKEEDHWQTQSYPVGTGISSTVQLGSFENAKIEEGRRAYAGRLAPKQERSFSCFNCFRH